MNRPLLAISSALLLLSAGCENSNSLTAKGPCEDGSAASEMTAGGGFTTQRKPDQGALWARGSGQNIYRPGQDGNPGAMSNAAVSVDALLEAMDVEMDLIETKSLAGNAAQSGIFTDMGALQPTEGSTMGWLSTGVAGAGTPESVDTSAIGTQEGTGFFALCPGSDIFENPEYDCIDLTFSFVVPDGMHSVRFDFAFMSVEYPEFVNLGFNDEFKVSLHSPTNNYDNIVFDDNGSAVNIDSAFFDEDCPGLSGTGFDIEGFDGTCDAGGTGLLSTIAPVEPGETATISFSLRDRGDDIYDSAVMIDNLAVRSTDVEEPNTDPCS